MDNVGATNKGVQSDQMAELKVQVGLLCGQGDPGSDESKDKT